MDNELKEIVNATETALDGLCFNHSSSNRTVLGVGIFGGFSFPVEDFKINPLYIDQIAESYGYGYEVMVSVGVVNPQDGNRYLDIYTPVSTIPDSSFDERFTSACLDVCNELRKEETQAVPFYIAYLDGLVMVQLSIMEQQFLSPNFAKRAILEMAFRKIVAVAKKMRSRLGEYGYRDFHL